MIFSIQFLIFYLKNVFLSIVDLKHAVECYYSTLSLGAALRPEPSVINNEKPLVINFYSLPPFCRGRARLNSLRFLSHPGRGGRRTMARKLRNKPKTRPLYTKTHETSKVRQTPHTHRAACEKRQFQNGVGRKSTH